MRPPPPISLKKLVQQREEALGGFRELVTAPWVEPHADDPDDGVLCKVVPDELLDLSWFVANKLNVIVLDIADPGRLKASSLQKHGREIVEDYMEVFRADLGDMPVIMAQATAGDVFATLLCSAYFASRTVEATCGVNKTLQQEYMRKFALTQDCYQKALKFVKTGSDTDLLDGTSASVYVTMEVALLLVPHMLDAVTKYNTFEFRSSTKLAEALQHFRALCQAGTNAFNSVGNLFGHEGNDVVVAHYGLTHTRTLMGVLQTSMPAYQRVRPKQPKRGGEMATPGPSAAPRKASAAWQQKAWDAIAELDGAYRGTRDDMKTFTAGATAFLKVQQLGGLSTDGLQLPEPEPILLKVAPDSDAEEGSEDEGSEDEGTEQQPGARAQAQQAQAQAQEQEQAQAQEQEQEQEPEYDAVPEVSSTWEAALWAAASAAGLLVDAKSVGSLLHPIEEWRRKRAATATTSAASSAANSPGSVGSSGSSSSSSADMPLRGLPLDVDNWEQVMSLAITQRSAAAITAAANAAAARAAARAAAKKKAEEKAAAEAAENWAPCTSSARSDQPQGQSAGQSAGLPG